MPWEIIGLAKPPLEKFQHFVSKMQLRRFANPSGKIHVWNKRAGKLLTQVPEKAFGQTHLYTTENAAGEKDTWYEKELSKLETHGNALLSKIEDAAAHNLAPTFSSHEKELLDLFFYTSWKRVPEFFDNAESIKNGSAYLDRLFADLRETHSERAAELDRLDTPEQRKRLLQEGKILGIASVSEKVLELISSRGLMILRLPPVGEGLIIGSLPVVRTKHPLTDPNSEVWLPISPKLMIGPGHTAGTINLADFDPIGLSQVNRAIANQSTMFAGPDPLQIHALAKSLT